MWLGEYHSIRLKNLQNVFTFLKGDFHEALYKWRNSSLAYSICFDREHTICWPMRIGETNCFGDFGLKCFKIFLFQVYDFMFNKQHFPEFDRKVYSFLISRKMELAEISAQLEELREQQKASKQAARDLEVRNKVSEVKSAAVKRSVIFSCTLFFY